MRYSLIAAQARREDEVPSERENMSRIGEQLVKLLMINVVNLQVLRDVVSASIGVIIDNVKAINVVKGQRVKLPGYISVNIK